MARLLHDDGHHGRDHDHDCGCDECRKHRRHHDCDCDDCRKQRRHHDWSGDWDCDSCSGSWSDACSGHKHHDDDCSCHRKHRRRRKHRREKLIPVGRITVDCSPVVFRTPGQAMNIVSCAVSQVLSVPVTRTTTVQRPAAFGCFDCIPVTETFTVPVQATVNVPPVLVPVPRTVCPPTVVRSTGCSSCTW